MVRPGGMRRPFRFQVVFAPVRLSADHLRSAYELVVPVVEREVRAETEAEAKHHRPEPRERARPRKERNVA